MEYSELWDYDFFIEYNDTNWWKSPRADSHFHKSYEIYYLVENEITYFVDNSIFHIIPGTVMVIPPNHIHATKSINENVRKRYLINLPEAFIKDLLRLQPDLLSQFNTQPIVFDEQEQEKITGLFEQILLEYEQNNPSPVMIKSLLGTLLVTIGRQATKLALNGNGTMKISEKTLNILNYINENYQKDLTLELLAKEFFLNRSYISRVFKKELNISFSEYLRTVRIRAACKMLITTNLSMTEISDNVGFKSCSDFCRVFKTMLKLSPLQYRKNTKQQMF